MNNSRAVPKKIHRISIFAWVSLIFSIVSGVEYFVQYTGSGYELHTYEIDFRFPLGVELIYFILGLVPSILFVISIYILKKHHKINGIMAIVYGSIALNMLFSVIELTIYNYEFPIISLIVYVAVIISFTLSAVNVMLNYKSKFVVILTSIIGIINSAYSLVGYFYNIEEYVEDGMYLYLFTWSIEIIGMICLYIALLFFGIHYQKLVTLPSAKENKNMTTSSSEQSLRLLQKKLEQGIITDEEYKAMRSYIVSRL